MALDGLFRVRSS